MDIATCAAGWLLTAAALACAPGVVRAQPESDTLALAEAVSEARAANPMLRAARLRADAAFARVPQAGALPDPMLSFALGNRPLDDFGTGEPMTMNTLSLSQTLPWPGKLGFAERSEAHRAEAMALSALELEVWLVSRVKTVYYDIAAMDRALAIMEETRELLREFLDVSNTLYAVGEGLQADVLQAQVAVASLTEDVTAIEQHRLAMVARLNALLGRGPERPVPAVELPEPGNELPDIHGLLTLAAEHRPALRAARQRVEAEEAAVRAAHRAIYPNLTLGAGFAQRPRFTDMLTLSVGISLPLWAGSRQLPMRDEARVRQAAEEAAELDLLNETYARIAGARAESGRARRLHDLYTTSIVPQARAAVESSLSAYRVGEVDFMTLVQNELTVNRYEIERVRLTAAYHAAVAEIEALIGGPLEDAR